MKLLALSLSALLMTGGTHAQTVTDGDTIKMDGITYRLWGIDAPETKQDCADGWTAGRRATRLGGTARQAWIEHSHRIAGGMEVAGIRMA